jgi:hypothetical protein
MSKVVFIFGAGAAVCTGAPVMSEIHEKAHKLYQRKLLGARMADFDCLNDAIFELQRSQSKIPIDFENLETVLDALEMAQVIGGFPDISAEVASRTSLAIKRLLAAVIESSILFPVKEDSDGVRRIALHEPYAKFLHLLQNCQSSTLNTDINYDILLDFMCTSGGIRYNYCLDGKSPPPNTIRLCKLHGSLNWKRKENGEMECLKLNESLLGDWSAHQDEAKGVRIYHDKLFALRPDTMHNGDRWRP